MRTLVLCLGLISGGPLAADAPRNDDSLRLFATCAGRLMAVIEHQWMFDGPASEITQRQRATLIEMIDAIMPPARASDVLAWRIDARAAQGALLRRASFARDPQDAAWARARAARETATCAALMLS